MKKLATPDALFLHPKAFLLRCWQEEGSAEWRFVLETVGHEPTKQGFKELPALFQHIQAQLSPKDE